MNPILKAALIIGPIWAVGCFVAVRAMVWLFKYNAEAYPEFEDCDEHPACQLRQIQR